MEKTEKISLMIVLNIVIGIGLTMLIIWTSSVYRIETRKIDLTQFSGRIIPAANINSGTFTIGVPMSEALKFGKDAILSYGEEGVKIWKPDNSTNGVFLYSSIISENIGLKCCKVSFYNHNEGIMLYEHPTALAYFATIFFLLVACAVFGIAIVHLVKTVKS